MTIGTASVATGAPARSVSARRAWTIVGLVLAVAFVAAGLSSVVGNVAYQSIPSSHRAFTGPLQAVSIEVGSGSITVEAGSGPAVVVETSGSRGWQWPSDHEQVSAGTLAIRSSCGTTVFNDRCTRDYVLRVPPRLLVTASSEQGDLMVTGVDGALDLHSGEGAVSVVGGSGALRLSSDQGDISAVQLDSQLVTATSGQGDVDLGLASPPSHVAASSDQGRVTIGLPHDAVPYQVHASSDQGAVTVAVLNDTTSPRVVQASSGEGDVSVRYGSP
jgi:Putative adhesin